MKAATYSRQSLDVAEGIDRQTTRTAQLVAARGWELVEEYADNDTSASKDRGKGTAWARMLDAIRAGEVTAVVAVDLDRLLRTTRDLNVLIDLGAKVVTVDGEIDLSTADGEFRATMLAGIARFETRRKSERQKRANEARVASGHTSSRPRQRPFGYDAEGLQPVPDEADAIREAYRAVIAGSSLGAVARRWNAARFVTSRGNAWTSGSVALVLASPRYMGRVAYKRQDAGPAEWGALVDEATWRAARSVLTVGTSGRPLPGRSLLGALAYCGACAEESREHVRSGSNNGRRSYRCNGRVQHLSRKAEDVEAYVAEVVRERLTRPDAVALLAPEAEDMTPIVTEAEEVRGRLDALAVQWADGAFTDSQFRVASERLRVRLEGLEARLASSRRGFEFAPLVAAGARAGEVWDRLDMDARRRLVGALATVTLMPAPRGRKEFDPASVRIDWKATVR